MENRKVREQELESIKLKLEKDLEVQFKNQLNQKVAEIEGFFEERAAKQEKETQLLKKTLLEQ